MAIQTMDMNVGGTDWDCTLGYLEIFDGCGDNKFLVDKICFSRYQNAQRYLWVSTGTCVTIQFNSAGGTKNKFNLVARHTSCKFNMLPITSASWDVVFIKAIISLVLINLM